MPRSLLVALLTMVVFAAGYEARVWTERQLPLPPPPPPGGEFATPSRPAGVQAGQGRPGGPHQPHNRAELAAEIEKLGPQIDQFRARLQQVDSEYDSGLLAVLTADQVERYNHRYHRHLGGSQRPRHSSDNLRPISDEEITWRLDRPLWPALERITVEGRLADLTGQLQLTSGQQAAIRRLMLRRRQEFLDLMDRFPPPTLILTELAPVAQRLAVGQAPGSDSKQP